MVYTICFGHAIAQICEEATTAAEALRKLTALKEKGALGLQIFDSENTELDQAMLEERAKLEAQR
jgi:hypothetical protein